MLVGSRCCLSCRQGINNASSPQTASLPFICNPTGDEITGHARLRLYTLCCRLEMYVSRELWLSLAR